jgi:hypothetical protein
MTNFYCPELTSRIDNITIEEATKYHDELFKKEYSNVLNSGLNKAQIALLKEEYGGRYIKEHFSQFIIMCLIGLCNELGGPAKAFISAVFSNNNFIIWIVCGLSMLYLVLTYALYILGLICACKKINIAQIYVFLLSGYLAAGTMVVGHSRYRDPWFPLILLSAISTSQPVIRWICTKWDIPILKRMEKYSNYSATL